MDQETALLIVLLTNAILELLLFVQHHLDLTLPHPEIMSVLVDVLLINVMTTQQQVVSQWMPLITQLSLMVQETAQPLALLTNVKIPPLSFVPPWTPQMFPQ